MYGYFANKSKHRLIVKNIHKNMAIYLKNRTIYTLLELVMGKVARKLQFSFGKILK